MEATARLTALAAAMTLQQTLGRTEGNATPEHYEAELEINDFPYNARSMGGCAQGDIGPNFRPDWGCNYYAGPVYPCRQGSCSRIAQAVFVHTRPNCVFCGESDS